MSDKMDLWRRVSVTDPAAVKPITGKPYSGNSPKPYWIVEQLTREFGPCGIGWGFSVKTERFERFGEGASAEALHIALVAFWYVKDGQRGELEQVGQTRAAYMTSKGKFTVDEDAPKKSVTDALVKCASYLGFAGDIFSGHWDDSKYAAEAGREWAERRRQDDPERARWIAERIAEINAADSKDKLRKVVEAALEVADRNADEDAANQINAALAAKVAAVKAKAAAAKAAESAPAGS
jgi:hypothetical protein